ncbi:MAG: response regulator [Anaerolineae bacterium]|nr:response regulator [Anaerolineae bacterium]
MGWDLRSWLKEHSGEIEARWLEATANPLSYAAYSGSERLVFWRPLIEVLASGDVEALREWSAQEKDARDPSLSEMLAISNGLFQAVRDLLPAKADRVFVDQRIGALARALAEYTAGEADRLAIEKVQLEALYDIARELNSSLDLPRVLQKALVEIVATSGSDKGAVYLTDDVGENVVPSRRVNWHDRSIPVDVLPSTWQMGRDDPLVSMGNLEEDAEAWVRDLADSGVAAMLVGPLIANGQFRGLMVLASSKEGTYDVGHEQLFRNFLSQVATAIGNAEVYRLISQQAQELGQMFRQQQEQATEREAILTSIADGVVVNDMEGNIILVNPAAERILGVSEKELLSRDFDSLFAAFGSQGEEEAGAAMETLLNTSVPEAAKSYKINLEADNRVIHALLSPVLSLRGDFMGVVTIFRDVTKEVEADRAKSEFVSTVSHELRTPMTAIKGYTDLLHAGAAGPINDEQKRFLTTIKSNTDRLTALINDLLDISRMETGRIRFEPRSLQVGEVVADVVNVLAGSAEDKHLRLNYEVAAGLPDVMGDRDRLNQVLTNLIGNAIRYTPDGGEIDVKVYLVERAVRVDVRDTGIGIAPEDMAHLFERFYRADHPLVQETRGTGLGLSIVKMFVEMHGGRIWVESEPDQGSTFTFILPIPVSAAEARRPSVSHLTAHVRTILIVDDDRDAADVTKRQLEGSGYRVVVMGRGRAASEWIEENRPDLVLLDLILPDLGGLDLLRSLKKSETTSDIPIVVQSIVPDDGTAWDLGAVGYLTKPVARDDLLHSVEQALTWQGRVLIVEDDPDTVGFLEAAMRQIGFTPLVAADGYEALTMTRRHRPDLILLDLRLPGMDGFEALTHLKRDAVTQTIPIIAISAHVADTERERKRLVTLGASAFLPKPFSIGDLLSEIEAALRPLEGPSAT